MSYLKLTDFAAKDALVSGNPLKTVKGTEIGAEFDAIATASALTDSNLAVLIADKAPLASPTFTGTVTGGTGGFSGAHNGTVGATTPSTGAFTAVTATGNITAYFSDERLKTNLGNIENALAKVQTLDGFYYEPNETAQALGYAVKREVGVSAQQVQAILPEIIAPAPIDNQYLTVDYARLVPLLIEAIKELEARVVELENK
jgi:hypothetical protein